MGCRTDESLGSVEKKSSGLEDDPENGIGSSGVNLSDVMVTGRQKLDASELKREKAS